MEKRRTYWLYFIERWAIWGEGGGQGITGRRLSQVYGVLMHDDDLWQDVIFRHGNWGDPAQMRQAQPETYLHCVSNFWGMVYQIMVERGLIH